MKTFVATCFLLVFCSAAIAQPQIAFKIITFSEGITVGDDPVTFGMDVPSSGKVLKIPNNGYVGIIAADGRTFTVTSSIAVDQINLPAVRKKKKWIISGPMYACGYPVIVPPLTPENDNADFVGDSLFLYWGEVVPGRYSSRENAIFKTPQEANYDLFLRNMFGEPLDSLKTNHNYVLLKARKEDAVLFDISNLSFQVKSDQYVIKRVKPERAADIQSQLDRIAEGPDKYYYQCAVYDLNKLRHNMSLPVYHILRDKITTTDPIMKAYFDQLSEKYSFPIIVSLN